MLILGHRGASRAAHENSLEAFRVADDMGADGVELDIRLTRDDKLLISHDPLPPGDADDSQLSAFVPFAKGLDACGNEMLVNVEIKNSLSDGGFDPQMAVVEPTIAELRRRGTGQLRRWLISSFSWATVQACRAAAPEIATAWLCLTIDDAGIRRVAEAGHSAVHPAASAVTAEMVGMCHAAGLALNTWTSNEPTRLLELAEMGADGVCTDVPDIALETFGRTNARGAVSPAWTTWPTPQGQSDIPA